VVAEWAIIPPGMLDQLIEPDAVRGSQPVVGQSGQVGVTPQPLPELGLLPGCQQIRVAAVKLMALQLVERCGLDEAADGEGQAVGRVDQQVRLGGYDQD